MTDHGQEGAHKMMHCAVHVGMQESKLGEGGLHMKGLLSLKRIWTGGNDGYGRLRTPSGTGQIK